MAPTKQKERKYVPPSWINEEFVKSLPADKQTYWANRIQGHPGQGPKPKKAELKQTGEATTFFDNEGRMFTKNRAARRKRPATDPMYTKSTHSQKLKLYGRK